MSPSLTTDISYGIVPIHRTDAGNRFLLIQHKAGHWGFPKGHPNDGELPAHTAVRELREETSLELDHLIERPCFTESYLFTKRKSGKRVIKTVTYYVGFVSDPRVTPCAKEVAAASCGHATTTRELISFPEGQELFDRVLAYLSQRPGGSA